MIFVSQASDPTEVNREQGGHEKVKFKEIFEGNNSAYGIMKLTGEVTEKGKAVAKALIKREEVR